jgi:ElaB/YqjD/DUF883 family membrane-anchored ribosome-binding protein
MEKPIETTNSRNSPFSRSVGSAADSVHRAIDGASDAASPAIRNMTASAHSTVDKMADGVNHAAEALATKSTQLHQLQQKLTDGTRAQVRSHPLLSLGIALAGGALVSFWLSRRADNTDVS